MTFSADDYRLMRQQAAEAREGRKVEVQVFSGVVGGYTNQFTEEAVGDQEVWVNVSGVVTVVTIPQTPFPTTQQGVSQGITTQRSLRLSFDYDSNIVGLTHAKKVIVRGQTFNVDHVEEDYFGDQILHVDFILYEGN